MDLSSFEKDNTKNSVLENEIPPLAKTEPCWLGIDEAGRGPVLGPMVYATAFSPLSMKEDLKEMGFADSKQLTEDQREKIFEQINGAPDKIGWIIHVLSPNYISNSMLRRSKYNLNALSHDTAIGLIKRAISRGAKIKEVYVDTVGDPGKYQEKLKDIFPDIDITVEKKADDTYQIVGGASICAKVARDHAVKNWTFSELKSKENTEEEIKYGSGYPSDPATKNFMKTTMDEVFGYPGFVRFSWSTASTILDQNAAPVRWEDDDEDDPSKGTAKLSKYFGPKGDQGPRLKRHKYFNENCLKTVTGF